MNGDIQMVPLSPQVIEILERLRSLSRFSELVLPGDHKYWKPMSENTVNTMLRNVGYDTSKDVCGHGFLWLFWISSTSDRRGNTAYGQRPDESRAG